MKPEFQKYVDDNPALKAVAAGRPILWINDRTPWTEDAGCTVTKEMITDAEKRLQRFAPFIARAFPVVPDGIIESPLREISLMREYLAENGAFDEGRLLIKLDSDLPITGSVKARGGIYEVLKHAEDLAVGAGLLSPEDDYSILCEPRFRDFFGKYAVQVGSTGNLGLSIGIMSAKLGFRVTVHMSHDARQWKKDKLRENGVNVIEYMSDYGKAVEEGRKSSAADPMSYFVDDENSIDLFLGYAVAAGRLKRQLDDAGIVIDAAHPLFIYIPCGVGGAPGGICCGIKHIFGDAAHVFFCEPTECCSMLIGLVTGLNDAVCVQDLGLSGRTEADGLACARPSALAGRIVGPMVAGIATVSDESLYPLMKELCGREKLFIEPSSCACFAGLYQKDGLSAYCREKGLEGSMKDAVHIVWATGGGLVPEDERRRYFNM